MSQQQPVNFRVKTLEKGDKPGFVHIDLVFDGESKVYSYYRKYGRDVNNNFAVVSPTNLIPRAKSTLLKGTLRELSMALMILLADFSANLSNLNNCGTVSV